MADAASVSSDAGSIHHEATLIGAPVLSSTTMAPWSPSVDFTIADASTPVTQGADFDLLASVFSDSLLLAVLGTTQPLVIPSSTQNDAPEEPRTSAIVLSINGTSQSEDTESPHEHIKA